MTLKGYTTIKIMSYCPDRWQYKFDGDELTIIEEFDECPKDTIDMSRQFFELMGFTFSCEEINKGWKVYAKIKSNQKDAIRGLLNEATFQANVTDMISFELTEEIRRRLEMSKMKLEEFAKGSLRKIF